MNAWSRSPTMPPTTIATPINSSKKGSMQTGWGGLCRKSTGAGESAAKDACCKP
jgi:hypothetical protein